MDESSEHCAIQPSTTAPRLSSTLNPVTMPVFLSLRPALTTQPDYPGTHCLAKADQELTILLPP